MRTLARVLGGQRRDPALAVGVALLAAGWLSWQVLRMPPEVSQFSKYPVAAINALQGTADPERTLDFSPAYLAASRAAYANLADPERGLLLLQVGCAAAAAGLLFLLLRRFAPTAIALAGAAAFALDRSVAVYAYVLEPEALVLLGLVACLCLAARHGPAAAAGAGAALALAFLARPSFLPLAAAIPLAWRARDGSWRALRTTSALFLLPVAAALLFLSLRNHALTGTFSPSVMNPGTVFFDGNNPLAQGYAVAYPPLVAELAAAAPGESDYQHAIYRRLARLESGRALSPAEANRFWAAKALAYLREHPAAAARRFARKLLWSLHAHRWHDLRAAGLADRSLADRGFPAFPLAAVSALAVAGAALGAARWRELLPAYAALLLQGGVMTATYASARQRVALLPLLCLFAGVAAAGLWSWRRERGGRLRAGAVLLGVAALAWLFSHESDLMRDHRAERDALRAADRAAAVADAALERGDRDAARRAAAESLAFRPWVGAGAIPAGVDADAGEIIRTALERFTALRDDGPSSRLDRAILLQMGGRPEEAARVLERLAAEGWEFERLPGRVAEPRYHLARIALQQGRREEAARLARAALAAAPGDPSVLALAAALTGEPEPAARLGRYFDAFDARLFLGRALLAAGRPADAARELEPLAAALPDYGVARALLDQAREAAAR